MTALYEHYVDPRDPAFRDPAGWEDAARLGHAGRKYATLEQVHARLLAAEPDASPERREELRLQAAANMRSNVSFYDATFSVQKSVTVLHTAFEAMEVRDRQGGDEVGAEASADYRRALEASIWAGTEPRWISPSTRAIHASDITAA